MGRWIERKPDWLPYKNPEAPERTRGRPKDENLEYGVRFVPVRCPGCKSRKVTCYATRLPIRYHRCRDCGLNFKSVEASDK